MKPGACYARIKGTTVYKTKLKNHSINARFMSIQDGKHLSSVPIVASPYSTPMNPCFNLLTDYKIVCLSIQLITAYNPS